MANPWQYSLPLGPVASGSTLTNANGIIPLPSEARHLTSVTVNLPTTSGIGPVFVTIDYGYMVGPAGGGGSIVFSHLASGWARGDGVVGASSDPVSWSGDTLLPFTQQQKVLAVAIRNDTGSSVSANVTVVGE